MPLGASFFEDVPLVGFIYLVFTRTPGGVTVGDSGLCCCVPCLSSAVISLCLLIHVVTYLFTSFVNCPSGRSYLPATGQLTSCQKTDSSAYLDRRRTSRVFKLTIRSICIAPKLFTIIFQNGRSMWFVYTAVVL